MHQPRCQSSEQKKVARCQPLITRLGGVGGSLFSSDAVGNIWDCREVRVRFRAALGQAEEPTSILRGSASLYPCPGHSDPSHFQVCVMCWRNSGRENWGEFRQEGQEEQSAEENTSAIAQRPGGARGCRHRDPGVGGSEEECQQRRLKSGWAPGHKELWVETCLHSPGLKKKSLWYFLNFDNDHVLLL